MTHDSQGKSSQGGLDESIGDVFPSLSFEGKPNKVTFMSEKTVLMIIISIKGLISDRYLIVIIFMDTTLFLIRFPRDAG